MQRKYKTTFVSLRIIYENCDTRRQNTGNAPDYSSNRGLKTICNQKHLTMIYVDSIGSATKKS